MEFADHALLDHLATSGVESDGDVGVSLARPVIVQHGAIHTLFAAALIAEHGPQVILAPARGQLRGELCGWASRRMVHWCLR